MSRRRSRRRGAGHPLVVGSVAIAFCVAAIVSSFTSWKPFSFAGGGELVRAEFPSADDVGTKTPVRVAGVDVGRVESVRLDTRRGTALVSMRIHDSGVQVTTDAHASLLWRTILGGPKQIRLDPGSPLAPPLGDRTIPLSQTDRQVEFDDLTRLFDRPAITGERAMLRAFGQGFQPPAAARAIDELAPDMTPVAPALRAFRGEMPDDLSALVRSSARTVKAFARDRAALRELVGGAQRTFRTFADDRRQLGAALDRAPATMDSTIHATRAIDASLPGLDRLVSDLRPGARRLAPAMATARPMLAELGRVLPTARPLLRRLGPAVGSLGDASRAGRTVVARLEPTIRRADDQILPILAQPDSFTLTPTYQLIGPTIASLGASTASFDGIGHLLNFPTSWGENPLTFLPCETSVTDETAAQKVRCQSVNDFLTRLFGGRGR